MSPSQPSDPLSKRDLDIQKTKKGVIYTCVSCSKGQWRP
jgi:hypothetical protein